MSGTTTVTVGTQDLSLYLADTPWEWRQGLAGHDLTATDGMLFSFGADVDHAFHMRGVPVPILIAFFTYDGDFVDLTYLATDAQPYQPRRPYRYALELVGAHATQDGAIALLPALLDGIDPP